MSRERPHLGAGLPTHIEEDLRALVDARFDVREEAFFELEEHLGLNARELVSEALVAAQALAAVMREGAHGRSFAQLLLAEMHALAEASLATSLASLLGDAPSLDVLREQARTIEWADRVMPSEARLRAWLLGDGDLADTSAAAIRGQLVAWLAALAPSARTELVNALRPRPLLAAHAPADVAAEATERMLAIALLRHFEGQTSMPDAFPAPFVVLGWLDVLAPVVPDLAARWLAALGTPQDARHRARAMRIAMARGDAADARTIATALVEEWCGPAVVGGANQVLTRRELLEHLEALDDPRVVILRERVTAAPSPDVAVPEGDFF